ncbi:hypothetical protein D3C87_2008940 [compost metagenome]
MMMKGMEEAFFAGQAFQEVQIGVTGLHAVFARQVFVGDRLFVVQDPVLFKHRLQDFGYGQVLENAPVGTQAGAGQ